MRGNCYPPLTAERLRELLHYDKATGAWTWRIQRYRSMKPGDPAGCLNKVGYWVIRVENRLYLAHRLAWLYMTGNWPTDQIDHKNMIRADNRWENLRAADNAGNNQNRPGSKTSISGVKGVSLDPRCDRWSARIYANGIQYNLGYYGTIGEAAAAYEKAAIDLHGEFARTE